MRGDLFQRPRHVRIPEDFTGMRSAAVEKKSFRGICVSPQLPFAGNPVTRKDFCHRISLVCITNCRREKCTEFLPSKSPIQFVPPINRARYCHGMNAITWPFSHSFRL